MLAIALVASASPETPASVVTGPHHPANLPEPLDLRVHGRVRGDLSASGYVCVPPGTAVHGTISARNIQVAGAVTGTLNAEEKIVLYPAAEFMGTFQAPIVEVHSGAQFGKSVSVDPKKASFSSSDDPRSRAYRPSLAPIPPGQTPEDLSLLDAPTSRLLH